MEAASFCGPLAFSQGTLRRASGPWPGKGHGRGCDQKLFSAGRFLTSAKWLIALCSAKQIRKVLVLILLLSYRLRIEWHKNSSVPFLVLDGAQFGGAIFGCSFRHINFSACYLQLQPLFCCTDICIFIMIWSFHGNIYFFFIFCCTDIYFFHNDLEFSWQQPWKPMAVIQVKLQATLCKIHSNLF